MTRASTRDSPPPRSTAAMREPSTSTSPENGGSPLPSRIVAFWISVLFMGSSSSPTIARNPSSLPRGSGSETDGLDDRLHTWKLLLVPGDHEGAVARDGNVGLPGLDGLR